MIPCVAGRKMSCRKVRSLINFYRADGVIADCFDEMPRQALTDIPFVWMDPPVGRVPETDSYVHHDGSATALRTYFEKRLGMTMREWRNRNAAS